MRIHSVNNYSELSIKAASLVAEEVTQKPNLLFCAATGNSPTGMYAEMAKQKSLYSHMRVIKMDEWGIIPLSHPDSCESYLQKHLLGPLEIPEDRYISFDTASDIALQECERMRSILAKEEPLDICILGLGKNAHIAFNEPGDILQPYFHKALLAPSTIQHDPALSQGDEPAYGLCIGMKDILQAKKIIFLVSGSGKSEAWHQIMKKEISTQCPASFLWMHPNVDCIIDTSKIEK